MVNTAATYEQCRAITVCCEIRILKIRGFKLSTEKDKVILHSHLRMFGYDETGKKTSESVFEHLPDKFLIQWGVNDCLNYLLSILSSSKS